MKCAAGTVGNFQSRFSRGLRFEDLVKLIAVPGEGDGEIRALWFEALPPGRVFTSPPKRDYRGSGKPFVTIEKAGLLSLGELLKKLKTHGLDDTLSSKRPGAETSRRPLSDKECRAGRNLSKSISREGV